MSPLRTALLGLAFVMLAAPAAASPSAKLVYVRGASAERCPGEPELRKAVAVRLGYDPFFPAASKTVIADVTRTEKGHRATVRIVRDDGLVRGERELATTGEDCGELVSALALAISIALDDLDEAPKREAVEEAPRPAPPPAPEPAPAPPPPDRTSPAPERGAVSLRLALGPTLSFASAPATALGGTLSGELCSGMIGVRADVRADLPAGDAFETPVAGAQRGRVATSLLLGTVAGCAHLGVGFACAGGGAGRIASETSGLARPASDAAAHVVLDARLGANLEVGSGFFLQPFVDVGAPLTRHRVQVVAVTVYTVPPVAVTAGALFGARVF